MATTTHPCAYPGCEDAGEYPAPRDPRNIYDRQYYCLRHIKEFNARWNGLNGFSPQEIFSMQHGGATWNRPTWKMGVGTKSFTAAKATMGMGVKDPFKLFEELQQQQVAPQPETSTLPPDVREACAELGLTPPLTAAAVRKRYHKLAKEHHPDLNKSAESADKIKRVNAAYKVVLSYIKDDDNAL
jgi:hypothetical protein